MENNKNTSVVVSNRNSLDLFNPETFALMQRVCKMYVNSELVPDMYKISDNNPETKAIGNCMIAIEVAHRIGVPPLMVMQNMVPIYGRPAWSSTFLISTVNTCGRFNPLKYRFENLGKVGKIEYIEYEWNHQAKKKLPVTKTFDGTNLDNWQCIAHTTPRGSSDILESTPITVVLAIQEGWYTKSGSKWKTMTKQMLTYRAASFWTKAYAPELSMGMQTAEEVVDFIDVEHEEVSSRTRDEKVREEANTEPVKEDVQFEKVTDDAKQPEPKQEGPDF